MPNEYARTRRFAATAFNPTRSSFAATSRRSRPMVYADSVNASRPVRPACWAEASSSTPTSRPGLGSSR